MTSAPVLTPKLAKLIALLSSDSDGEVINAVRAMERLLKKNGQGFTDLAQALVGSRTGCAESSINPQRSAAFRDVARFCSTDRRCVDPNERRFVKDMLKRLNEGRPITEKQERWLLSIFNRIKRRYEQ